MRRDYQHIPRSAAIYQIRNICNGKRYIGSTQEARHRWTVHRSSMKAGKHVNSEIQADFNEFGINAFECEIVTTCEDMTSEERKELENIIIKAAKPEYNCWWTGKAWQVRTQEMIQKGIESRRNGMGWAKHSEETKRKIGEAHRGKTVSLQTRMKLSEANTGRKRSPETRLKMVDSRKRYLERKRAEAEQLNNIGRETQN